MSQLTRQQAALLRQVRRSPFLTLLELDKVNSVLCNAVFACGHIVHDDGCASCKLTKLADDAVEAVDALSTEIDYHLNKAVFRPAK